MGSGQLALSRSEVLVVGRSINRAAYNSSVLFTFSTTQGQRPQQLLVLKAAPPSSLFAGRDSQDKWGETDNFVYQQKGLLSPLILNKASFTQPFVPSLSLRMKGIMCSSRQGRCRGNSTATDER